MRSSSARSSAEPARPVSPRATICITASICTAFAVLPLEWWDAKWIADNIQPKLDGLSSDEIAEMQKPRGAVNKRRR
jgi:hypothetical protein